MSSFVRLRPPIAPLLVGRASVRARVCVGEDVATPPGAWLPMFTHKATDSAAEHMAIPVGAVVTFSGQFGTKDEADETDEASFKGRVDAAREPFSTDDLVYNVTLLDVLGTWDLHPGVPMPEPGTVFVLSPNHVETIESLPSAASPPPPTPTAIAKPPPSTTPPPAKVPPKKSGWLIAGVVGAVVLVAIGFALTWKA